MPLPANGIAVAKNNGRPGTSSSGCRTYGTSSSSGWRVQALTPASASDAPINFRKFRRPTGSSHSDAFCGNSRWRKSLNSGVSVSDSRLRQYSRPRVPSSRARSASMFIRSLIRVLSMARRAGRQVLDAVLLHEPRPELLLRDRRAVAHRENVAARTDELLRFAVTVQTPLHLQRVLLHHQRHLVDPSVTRLAAHPLLHVDAVVEIDEIRQVVHTNPVERGVVAEARAHRLEDRAVRPQLRMAVHTGLGRRNSGERRRFHRRVTVAAIDPVVADVMRVAELKRLFDEFVGARHVRRTPEDHDERDGAACQEQYAGNTDFREGVRAAIEDLRHRRLTVVRPRGRALTSNCTPGGANVARLSRGYRSGCTML